MRKLTKKNGKTIHSYGTKDLGRYIAKAEGIPQQKANQAVTVVFSNLRDLLIRLANEQKESDDIYTTFNITGVGKFTFVEKAETMAIHPATKRLVLVKRRKRMFFKQGHSFKKNFLMLSE